MEPGPGLARNRPSPPKVSKRVLHAHESPRRAGRRQRTSLGVLVASSEPLDQYMVRHPEFFFGASPEHARIDPDQLLILMEHLRCAAFDSKLLEWLV